MQSKILGTSGELRVAHELYKRGYACFAEMGDTSRIDLIAAIGKRLVRIQVKSLSMHRDGKRSELRLRPELAANGQSNPDNLLANYMNFNRAFDLGDAN